MTYSTKNYTEQGGERTVRGGALQIAKDGKLLFGDTQVKKALYQSDSEATALTQLKEDFNRLLAKLQQAGFMWAEAPAITLLDQSEDITVTEGAIDEQILVEADVTGGAVLTYQWYSHTVAETTGGTVMAGATEPIIDVPSDLTQGTYYYYCVVSAEEAESVVSDVITVTVE